MKKIEILSWNVNGIRAVERKSALNWFYERKPDILCIQETKAHAEQLSPALRNIEDYNVYFSSAERKGYSGVAIYSKLEPQNISTGINIEKFDKEGRILIADYNSFVLFNIYFPNGKQSKERLQYKMNFYETFLNHVNKLKSEGRKIVICGDVNTAHQEIDLTHPKQNEKTSGFLPQERAWIDKLINHGFVDTFRMFNNEPGHYTWWDARTRARERNVGWRIDYFFISENLTGNVQSAFILPNIMGSDHCPLGITISILSTIRCYIILS